MKLVLFLFAFLPFVNFGQGKYATFSADTTRISHEKRSDIHAKIMEAEWRINGNVLKYGSTPVQVSIDQQLDTIFYKPSNGAKWDTLICSISEAKAFTFIYNECCGGFNVADETGKFIAGQISFKVLHPNSESTYLGTIGEAGTIIQQNAIRLAPACRSALSPNIYSVSLKEVDLCNATEACPDEICLIEKGKELFNYGQGYTTNKSIVEFLYLPLREAPLHVTYDVKSNNVVIE